jgi:dsDNA-specific endonuclease/ATPase MutS2
MSRIMSGRSRLSIAMPRARATAVVRRGGRVSDSVEPDDDPDPVILPIEDSLDLHAFHPRDVRAVVEDYLTEAAGRGFAEVRLIHGRGIGAQRAIVQSLLAKHPLVVRFFDAPAERGGWGATIALLRPAPGDST